MRRGLLTVAIATAGLLASTGQAMAVDPVIVNGSRAIQNNTTSRESGQSANHMEVMPVVKSDPGVKIRIRMSVPCVSAGSRNVDSEKFISCAIVCICSAVNPRASGNTASWFPSNGRWVKTS